MNSCFKFLTDEICLIAWPILVPFCTSVIFTTNFDDWNVFAFVLRASSSESRFIVTWVAAHVRQFGSTISVIQLVVE